MAWPMEKPTRSAGRPSTSRSIGMTSMRPVLHLLGIDHERLTYYHNGIQRRLTNVHGQVIHDIIS